MMEDTRPLGPDLQENPTFAQKLEACSLELGPRSSPGVRRINIPAVLRSSVTFSVKGDLGFSWPGCDYFWPAGRGRLCAGCVWRRTEVLAIQSVFL